MQPQVIAAPGMRRSRKVPSLCPRAKLPDVVLVPEQEIGADDAMVETVRPEAVIDEADLAHAPVQRRRRAVHACRRRRPYVVDPVERESARLMLVSGTH